MRTILDISNDFIKAGQDEGKIGSLLSELNQRGLTVAAEWIDSDDKWEAQLFPGNDLSYFGQGPILGVAVADALKDYFQDYDCE